jgi:hypothetical protein
MTDTTNAGPVLPELPEHCETSFIEGPQGSEYRATSSNFEDWTARHSHKQMIDYGRQCWNAGADSEKLKSAALVKALKEVSESLGHMGAEYLKARAESALRAVGGET